MEIKVWGSEHSFTNLADSDTVGLVLVTDVDTPSVAIDEVPVAIDVNEVSVGVVVVVAIVTDGNVVGCNCCCSTSVDC
jgi:hypothetical protein